MASITEVQWEQVVEYIKRNIKIEPLNTPIVVSWPMYNAYKEAASKRAKKKPVTGLYKEEWDRFWQLWPQTKSVPGTAYVSGAKMKGSEQKMYEKWLNVVQKDYKIAGTYSEEHMINKLHRAADCYLQWCYEDSKRLGRNEMQYRNNLDVWFNQQLYVTYSTLAYPVVQKEKAVLQNSTDM